MSDASLLTINHSSRNRLIHARQMAKPATRVLLIEDNRSDVVLVSHMLRSQHADEAFDITDIASLGQALSVLDTHSFDIVLLDLTLLDIDGVAAVAALHAEKPHLPIIVYSGTYDAQLRHDALMCGAKHYLVKGRESAFSLKFMIRQTLEKCPA